MKYKPIYSELLVLSSIFYFFGALMDYTITMSAYKNYGVRFFMLESNQFICNVIKSGYPPIYIIILPIISIILALYFKKKIKKADVVSNRITYGLIFAIFWLILVGTLHLIGFCSWFYHGAF